VIDVLDATLAPAITGALSFVADGDDEPLAIELGVRMIDELEAQARRRERQLARGPRDLDLRLRGGPSSSRPGNSRRLPANAGEEY
jgi:hypothetical protein